MSAFIDATCPECRKRFGWLGELTDRPPCPNCGDLIPKAELEEEQKLMDEMQALLLKRKRTREQLESDQRGELCPE